MDKIMAAKTQLVRNFMQRRGCGDDDQDESVDGIHPDWLVVQRVIAQHNTMRTKQEYLVK